MKKLLFACAAVAVIGLVEANSADAGIRLSFGFGNSRCGSGFGGYSNSYYRGSSYGNSYYRPTFQSYRRPYYHDTSHYDYHPTTIQRHRDHYHIIPGHYHLHRTGHWHR